MFFNKEGTVRVLLLNDEQNVKVLDIFKHGKNTYKLFCDVKKASNTMGINNNYCISKLTDAGWVIIADINDLHIQNVALANDRDETLKQIDVAFEVFKSFAKQL